MVRREDVATVHGQPFLTLPTLPEHQPHDGVAKPANEEIRPARTGNFGHRPCQYRPFRTLAVSRSLAMVTRAPGRRPGRIQHSDPKRAPVAERRLVIVESPAKAKTIAGYLGDGYVVESSIGHIRDLPNRAADIPAAVKKEPWARLGVNVDDEFQPLYVVDPDKKKKVDELKRELKNATELLLATDEDREGEAIAWHLLEVLKPEGARQAHGVPRDHQGRDPARARRDARDRRPTSSMRRRRGGYSTGCTAMRCPLCSGRRSRRGLSAGRVQSVATRLVVERERERMKFVSASYWDIVGTFDPDAFEAKLVAVDGRRIAQGRDFGDDGVSRATSWRSTRRRRGRSRPRSRARRSRCARSRRSPTRRSPAAPFMTSTLQQEASRKLRFSSQTTMRVAQRLYENGYITYMRTDSTTLSESALTAARAQAAQLYGAEFVPAAPRRYERKVKNAQEAHEAIRPAGDSFRMPADVERELSRDEHALYELVWKRTVASQMEDARGQTASLRLGATASDGRDAEFGASGTVITFRGFLAAYEEGRDEELKNGDDERRLPLLQVGEKVERPRSSPTATPPRLPPATPRRRSSRRSRTGASAAHRRTRRSWGRSSTAATSSRRAPPSSRRSSRSRSRSCSRSTSHGSSTTSSPPCSRTISTRSPRARRTGSTG